MKTSTTCFWLCGMIGLLSLMQDGIVSASGQTQHGTNSTDASRDYLNATSSTSQKNTTQSNVTEQNTHISSSTNTSYDVTSTILPATVHPISVNKSSETSNVTTSYGYASTPSGAEHNRTVTNSTLGKVDSTEGITTSPTTISVPATLQNNVTTQRNSSEQTTTVAPHAMTKYTPHVDRTTQSFTTSTSAQTPASTESSEERPTHLTSTSNTSSVNKSASSVPGLVIHSGPSSGSLPAGASVALGVVSALLLIALVVVIYKYQRKFLYAVRFRRLQEVPMDDFDDDGIADAIYAENTVPRIQFRV